MQTGSSFLAGTRVVVIGAGAVGSVVAYRLAQAGADVSIVERRHPGSGTSGNSFAWLNSFGKTPLPYHRLNARSIRDHQELERELDGNWVHVEGGLTWANAEDSARVSHLREGIRRLHSWGYRVETLTPEQVMRDLEPDLSIDPDAVDEVYYTPGEGWINAVGLCASAIQAAVKRYGARYVHADVTGFVMQNGAIEAVQLGSGETLPADVVVNAAGPYAAEIAALAGSTLPVGKQAGLFAITEPAPVTLRCVVHSPHVAFRSEGGWRLVVRQLSTFDPVVQAGEPVSLSHQIFSDAMQQAVEVIPGLEGIRLEGLRIGVRPMPKDGHPVIGFDDQVGGLYHTVMHSGITLSAAVGTLVTEAWLGAEPPELEHYRIERFGESAQLAYATSEE